MPDHYDKNKGYAVKGLQHRVNPQGVHEFYFKGPPAPKSTPQQRRETAMAARDLLWERQKRLKPRPAPAPEPLYYAEPNTGHPGDTGRVITLGADIAEAVLKGNPEEEYFEITTNAPDEVLDIVTEQLQEAAQKLGHVPPDMYEHLMQMLEAYAKEGETEWTPARDEQGRPIPGVWTDLMGRKFYSPDLGHKRPHLPVHEYDAKEPE